MQDVKVERGDFMKQNYLKYTVHAVAFCKVPRYGFSFSFTAQGMNRPRAARAEGLGGAGG